VLALSILIILALGVAVVSFFVEGTHWLLFVSLGLVVLAFYLSRRPVRARPGSGDEDESLGAAPVRRRLIVTIDDDIIGPESRQRRYQRLNESSDQVDRPDQADWDDQSDSAAAAGNFADGRAHVA
jgi:hypothetical protein